MLSVRSRYVWNFCTVLAFHKMCYVKKLEVCARLAAKPIFFLLLQCCSINKIKVGTFPLLENRDPHDFVVAGNAWLGH